MTASLNSDLGPRDGSTPIVVDLAAPGVYVGLVNMANVIEQHIRAMPLEAMSARAEDDCGLILLAANDSNREIRRTRAVVQLLASTQRELVKIHARYGE